MIILVVFGVITIIFIITRVVPARPELVWAGPHAREETIRRVREMLHLDDPIWVQYMYYINSLVHGDLGVSWRTKHPVLDDILSALPATLELAIAGFIIGTLVGFPLGLVAALRYGGYLDKLIRILAVISSAAPVFWVALMFQTVFSIELKLLPGAYRIDPNLALLSGFKPITGFYTIDTLLMGRIDLFIDVVERLIMPSLVVAMYPLGLTARMVRALALETLQEDFVRNLRGWGVSDLVIVRRYLLKAIITPVVASLGLSFAYTLVGAFLVEIIFSWGGLGTYISQSLLSYDYPAIIGGIMVVAIFYSVINFIVDLVHAYIDPRVRL